MTKLRRTMGFVMFTTAVGIAWLAGCQEKPAEQPVVVAPVDAGPPVDAAPPPPAPAPQAGPCDTVQLAALTTMFPARAKDEAPGMQPEGSPICNVLPEGQTATSEIFTLQQGYCYTVIGASLPAVTELDLQLIGQPAAGIPVPSLQAVTVPLMTDTTTGPNAVVGPKNDCYHYTLPVPATVRVTLKARAGGGPVAAQVYKKKKF
ncbi:MAG: hypothetical protein U0441_14645 [Polyangiaceae bacterium]